VWDDHERALRELRTHFDLLGREYALDPARIVLAGFSQGAALTARLASCGALPVAGFIAVAPGNLDVDALALAAQPGRRGYVISGGQDRRHSQHAALAAALTGRGLPCALEVFNELDHEFPPDFETVLSKALSFLFVG
jgi:predicted esterase